MRTRVSVVIPTFNYGQFIREGIESVLAQTHAVAEIIVVDDGSTDDTEAVVGRFGDRVVYIRQENGGVSAARNNGVQNSSGDIVAFLDADDTWQPDKIEKQILKFDQDAEIGLVHCGMREFEGTTGETIEIHLEGAEGWVADNILLWQKPSIIGPASTILVKRMAWDNVGGFDTRLKNGEDWEFCLRVARKYKVGFVPEALVNYRNHGVNAHLNIAEMERSTKLAWEKAFDTTDENVLRLRRRSYGNLHRALAGSYFQAGDYASFIRHAAVSLWYKPQNIGYYLNFPLRRLKKPR